MNDLDSLILSFHDSLVFQSDLDLLKEGQWINDRIIGFVYEYLEKEVFPSECNEKNLFAFLNPSSVQYLKLCESLEEAKMCFLEPLELKNKSYVFLPLNSNQTTDAGGSHWSLLVIDLKSSVIKHYDSIGSNEEEAKRFSNKYKNFFGIKKFESQINFPQQNNSYDCGAFVLGISKL